MLQNYLAHRSEISHIFVAIREGEAADTATPTYWRGRENDNPKLEIFMRRQNFGPPISEEPIKICVVFTTTHDELGRVFEESPYDTS